MTEKPGPTGKFPHGKLNDSDKGELAVGIAVDERTNTLVINFGTFLEWTSMPTPDAETFANMIFQTVRKKLKDDPKANFATHGPDGITVGGIFVFEIRDEDGMVTLTFEKPVDWIALPKKHAIGFAEAIFRSLSHADKRPN